MRQHHFVGPQIVAVLLHRGGRELSRRGDKVPRQNGDVLTEHHSLVLKRHA